MPPYVPLNSPCVDAANVVTFAFATITKAGNYQLFATGPGAVTLKTTARNRCRRVISGTPSAKTNVKP